MSSDYTPPDKRILESKNPQKLTGSAHYLIIAAITAGATHSFAARSAGISRSSLARWLEWGEDNCLNSVPSTSHNLFVAVGQAEFAHAKTQMEHIGNSAEDGDWRAAAWILERRYPKDYGKQLPLPDPDLKDKPPQLIIQFQGEEEKITFQTGEGNRP